MNPIPLTILSGFLGAGKTTVLNALLRANHGLKIAVLVNDFGAINIDAQLIVGVQDETTIALENGCICCSIRGDLLEAALRLVERPDCPDHIIVEPSGVSDPVSVAQTFLLPELRDRIRVDSIVAVVDAEQLTGLKGPNAYMAYEQLAIADLIVINKVDLVTPEELKALYKHWMYPQARIIETSFGNVPPEVLLGTGGFAPERVAERQSKAVHVHAEGETHDAGHDEHEHIDHTLLFRAYSWTSDQTLSVKALQKMLHNLPASIYRMKGVLNLQDDPARRAILHVVGSRVTLEPGETWKEGEHRFSQVVAIAAQGDGAISKSDLDARLEGCVAARQPTSIAEQIKNSVITWFRR